jgi:serine/threonine protein phosphatase PrpC
MRSGGKVRNRRVAGALTVSRALGDHFLKNQGVISEPSVEAHEITPEDLFLVIASDGLWDKVQG